MNEPLKPINTSIYDFPELIKGGYAYVDKTAQLYELVKPGADMLYYLPRPRRFGKSLMISTLKALFQGRRELFKGLAIERTDWDWEKEVYPVLHLDMSQVSSMCFEDFKSNLLNFLEARCRDADVPFDAKKTVEANFLNLLEGYVGTGPDGVGVFGAISHRFMQICISAESIPHPVLQSKGGKVEEW